MVWPCRFVLQQVTLFSLITQWVKTESLGFYIETFAGISIGKSQIVITDFKNYYLRKNKFDGN